MKVALFIDEVSLFTPNVREHVQMLQSLPGVKTEVFDYRSLLTDSVSLDAFDALIHHYTLRLAIPHYSLRILDKERQFKGRKLLFIQDEYDHVNLTKGAILFVGYDVVFTCVPEIYAPWVYRGIDQNQVDFVNVLTGYFSGSGPPPSKLSLERRPTIVGYRGRRLPARYGTLGTLKWKFGEVIKSFAQRQNVSADISSAEEDRIYGLDWTHFLDSCRVTPVTPSGSNVFDFNGTLLNYPGIFGFPGKIMRRLPKRKEPTEHTIMNQPSPRVYEAIARGSVLLVPTESPIPFLVPNSNCISYSGDPSDDKSLLADLKNINKLEKLNRKAQELISPSGPFHQNQLIHKVLVALDSLDHPNVAPRNRISLRTSKKGTRLVSTTVLVGRFLVAWLLDYHLVQGLRQVRFTLRQVRFTLRQVVRFKLRQVVRFKLRQVVRFTLRQVSRRLRKLRLILGGKQV